MLKLISYLAPSIPAGLYETVATAIRELMGMEVDLQFEERISGPLQGDENPFTTGKADLGFVCAPTYRSFYKSLQLLPSPVPTDPRSGGKAVYFSDIVVASDARLDSIADLRGQRLAYNDLNSHSGWFCVRDYIHPESPDMYFSGVFQSGSHLNSLSMVLDSRADAAGIDSNALRYYRSKNSSVPLKVIDTLGPFPIQPVVIRSDMDRPTMMAVRQVLFDLHQQHGKTLNQFGFERFVDTRPEQYLYSARDVVT